MRKLVALLFSFTIVLCVLGSNTQAQSQAQNPCVHGAGGQYRDLQGNFLPGLYDCQSPPEFLFIGDTCLYNACPPPPEGGHFCPFCAKPISLANGNTYITQTDVKVPGLGGGLTLERTWNSAWPSTQMASQVGVFGPNWRSTYEERIFLGSDNYVKYARSDGSFWSFVIGGSGYIVIAPANGAATLSRGTSYWTLTFANGEQRLFDINSGSLIQIIDRNGNATRLTYDGLNRLVTVTDPVSRHLTFTYASSTSLLVTAVNSDVGLSLTYNYDSQNRLSKVTKPDQTTLTFQYDSNSMITAVLDTNGIVLESHTYDSNQRGLTSSRANGVEAVTISYQ
jgi:YD repeat-containing protein